MPRRGGYGLCRPTPADPRYWSIALRDNGLRHRGGRSRPFGPWYISQQLAEKIEDNNSSDSSDSSVHEGNAIVQRLEIRHREIPHLSPVMSLPVEADTKKRLEWDDYVDISARLPPVTGNQVQSLVGDDREEESEAEGGSETAINIVTIHTPAQDSTAMTPPLGQLPDVAETDFNPYLYSPSFWNFHGYVHPWQTQMINAGLDPSWALDYGIGLDHQVCFDYPSC